MIRLPAGSKCENGSIGKNRKKEFSVRELDRKNPVSRVVSYEPGFNLR